jgi:hypothetical protein
VPENISIVIFILVQNDLAGPTKCKYQDDFIKSGFTSTVINSDEKSKCVICCEVLENESFDVNKLMRYLETKHGSLADRGAEFLRQNLKL